MSVLEPSLFRTALLALLILVLAGPTISAADGSEPEARQEASSESVETSIVGETESKESSTAAGGDVAAESLVSGATSWIQFTDPATGKPRRVTPEELREFLLTARARGEDPSQTGQPLETVLEDGTVIVHMGGINRQMLFSSVGSDGKVSMSHSPDQLVNEAKRQSSEHDEESHEEANDDQ